MAFPQWQQSESHRQDENDETWKCDEDEGDGWRKDGQILMLKQ